MNTRNFFEYEINKILCDHPSKNFGYYKPSSDIKRYIIEYIFGTSKIILPISSQKNSFGLISFKALAECDHFSRLVENDRRILPITKEIKDIYLEKIINKNISSTDLIDNHMKPLIRILFDPYISSDEFYNRAKSLKENLLTEHKTYVSENILFPEYYAEQERFNIKKKRKFEYRDYLRAVA